MSIKLVVFDIAGTTVKDDHHVSKAFQAALNKFGYAIPLDVINPMMGYEKNQAILQILQSHGAGNIPLKSALVREIHTEFVREMIRFYQTAPGIEPLPHVEETFAELRRLGMHVALNTGFSRDIAETVVDRLGWRQNGTIDALIASDEVELGRPHPFMIQKLMLTFGISEPWEVAKVGDTEVDMREGQNAGCRFIIGVTTGIFTRSELEKYGPTHIVDDIRDVTVITQNGAV